MGYDGRIKKVAIIGAGVMGSGVAAVYGQRRPVYLLNRSPLSKAETGVENAASAARLPTLDITPGTYETDFTRMIGDADLIIDCLGENYDLKGQYFGMVDEHRKPDAIVSTSSSGLSIARLAEGRSDSFRKHFLGIHPYNPPTKLIANELIPGPDTAEEVVQEAEDFLREVYHRKIVHAKDTPAYAGNRIGFQLLNAVAQLAEDIGVDEIDYLMGDHTGRAMAPLRTIDLVGWDVHKEIVDNIHISTDDEAHATFLLPQYMQQLIAEGVLGDKTGKGFYTRGEDGRLVLDIGSGNYRPLDPSPNSTVTDAKNLIHVGNYPDAMKLMLSGKDGTEDIRRILLRYVSYAGERVSEAADSMDDINRVMAFGFSWIPPDGIVDLVGSNEMVKMLREEGLPVPKHIEAAGGRQLYNEPYDRAERYMHGEFSRAA